MKKRESLSGQVVAANLLLVVAALFAASAASSLDLQFHDQRLSFALLAMTVILALLLNILMLQRRFSPLEELIRQIEAIDPSDPASFEAPEEPVEEVERLAHAFAKPARADRGGAPARRPAAAAGPGGGAKARRARPPRRGQPGAHGHPAAAGGAHPDRTAAPRTSSPRRRGWRTRRWASCCSSRASCGPTALDDHGFVPAIEEQLRRFKAQYGIETSLRLDGELDDLRHDQQLVLYRVTQEALNNVVRHAVPSSVSVEIARVDGSVALKVADDGAGFAVGQECAASGLDGMAERARLVDGEFDDRRAPGPGHDPEAAGAA